MILFKRPVITCLIFYVAVILTLEYIGFFTAEKQSFLIHNLNRKNIQLTGKVADEPVVKGDYQQFVFEVSHINDIPLKKEKTLASVSKNYNVNYGDILCLSGRIIDTEEPVFPYVFNYKKYLQRENIYTKFYASGFEFTDSEPSKIKYLSFKIKRNINEKIDTFFREPYSAVVKSMITGDKNSIDEEIKNDFVDSGVVHILVISGLHIGFWVVIFLFIFRVLQIPLKWAMLLTVPALFFYSVITGANPPAIRASVMASCIIISFALNREPLIYNAISLAALIILIYSPQSLFTASFQLSFVATLGIIYLYPKIKSAFGKYNNIILLKSVIDIFCATLCVQIALTPVLMFYFGKISMISFVANILILPVVGFIVGSSLVFYVFSFFSTFLTTVTAEILSFVLKIVLAVIKFCAGLKSSVLYCGVPDFTDIFLYYTAVILMVQYKHNIKFAVSVLSVLTTMYIFPLKEKNSVRVFENYKSITYHIKKDNKNIIAFKQKKNDRYFISNLKQYLLMSGTDDISEIYCSDEDIKNKLPDIKIKSVVSVDKFEENTGFRI